MSVLTVTLHQAQQYHFLHHHSHQQSSFNFNLGHATVSSSSENHSFMPARGVKRSRSDRDACNQQTHDVSRVGIPFDKERVCDKDGDGDGDLHMSDASLRPAQYLDGAEPHDSPALSRTRKRGMAMTGRERERMGQHTFSLLFAAQRTLAAAAAVTAAGGNHTSHPYDVREADGEEELQASTACVDCGATTSRSAHGTDAPASVPRNNVDRGVDRNVVMESCGGCGSGICRNCSITVYSDHGGGHGSDDCQACLACFQRLSR